MNNFNRRLAWAGCLALFVCCWTGEALADDFADAQKLIAARAPNIAYREFCKVAPTGDDKAACQIQKDPAVGFLVCQRQDLDGVACKTVIGTELKNLATVRKAGLATVDFKPNVLGPVKCFAENSNNCYGYLSAWVADGKFVNLDDTFEAGRVPELSSDIEKYTKPGRAKATARSLQAIIDFMTSQRGKYSRVCDLQGFYLRGGGFVINDVPEVVVGTAAKPDCGGEDMPGFDKALAGLAALVAALNGK